MSLTKTSFHLIAGDISPATVLKGLARFDPQGNATDKVAVSTQYLRESGKLITDSTSATKAILSIQNSHLEKTGRVLEEIAIYTRMSDRDDGYQTAFIGALSDIAKYYPVHEDNALVEKITQGKCVITKFKHITNRSSLISLIYDIVKVYPESSCVLIIPPNQQMPVSEPIYDDLPAIFARPPSDASKYDWVNHKYFVLDLVNERITELTKERDSLRIWENA